jgi:WD repeat-containing protein 26
VKALDKEVSITKSSSNLLCLRMLDQLRLFTNTARQLHSSIAVLVSAYDVRKQLAYLLPLFRVNASALFPRKVQVPRQETVTIPTMFNYHNRNRSVEDRSEDLKTENLDLEDFPKLLRELGEGFTILLTNLRDVPHFSDDAVDESIMSFIKDLEVWPSYDQTD